MGGGPPPVPGGGGGGGGFGGGGGGGGGPPPTPQGAAGNGASATPNFRIQKPTSAKPAARAPAQPQGDTGGWKVRCTVDGGEYYHNVNTDEVSWEKPYELQTPEERQTDTSDCVWLPSDQLGGWVPAYVLSRAANRVRVRPVQGGKEAEVPTGGKGAQALYPLKLSHLDARFMQARSPACSSGGRPRSPAHPPQRGLLPSPREGFGLF